MTQEEGLATNHESESLDLVVTATVKEAIWGCLVLRAATMD